MNVDNVLCVLAMDPRTGGAFADRYTGLSQNRYAFAARRESPHRANATFTQPLKAIPTGIAVENGFQRVFNRRRERPEARKAEGSVLSYADRVPTDDSGRAAAC